MKKLISALMKMFGVNKVVPKQNEWMLFIHKEPPSNVLLDIYTESDKIVKRMCVGGTWHTEGGHIVSEVKPAKYLAWREPLE